MPETRCVTVHHPDGTTTQEDCHEISDAELVIEAVEKETSELNEDALTLFLNWDTLSQQERREALKICLGDFISKHRENYT